MPASYAPQAQRTGTAIGHEPFFHTAYHHLTLARAYSKPWTPEDDAKLRELVKKYGANVKWATIAVEANFGHDSAACEARYKGFVNPKLNAFAFGGASKGGAVEAHDMTKTGKPGHGFNLAYYPDAVPAK